jgi:hypothetical protein
VLVVGSGVTGPLTRGETFNPNASGEDWRGAAALLEERLQPGDLVLLRPGLVETEALYRGAFPDACRGYLAAPLGVLYLSPGPDVVLLPPHFDPSRRAEAYHDRVGRHLTGRARVWFVMLNPPDPAAYYQAVARYVQQEAGHPFGLGLADGFEYRGQITVALFIAENRTG